MIEDRTKTALLVVELKEKDIQFWWKIDDEVRQILDEHKLTERGVWMRYYMFWSSSIGAERRQPSDAEMHRLVIAEDEVHGENDELDGLRASPWLNPPADRWPLFRNLPELEPRLNLSVGPTPTAATSRDQDIDTAILAAQFEPSNPEDLPSLICA